MRIPTREEIEAVSRLLHGCRLSGAKFATGARTEVTMPDGRIYRVDELVTSWRFSHRGFRRAIKKSCSAHEIKDQILELHVTITKALQTRKQNVISPV